MKKIMFVCHGNICRSPMAEFIFKEILREENTTDYFVASSATSDEAIGCKLYRHAREELQKRNIPYTDRRAVRFVKEDYARYDVIVCMDDLNIVNLFRIIGEDKDKKVHKLMDFTEQGGNVDDPWYSGNFRLAYEDIDKGCRALYTYLENNK